MHEWKVLESRYLLKRWWMNLREDRVLLPNGTEIDEFHVIEYPDWCSVVCFTARGELVMVEQYRHGIGRMSLELPAGAMEPGEPALDAARRELLEETGYDAEQWTPLGRCAPEPSKHSNYAYLFRADGAVKIDEQDLDATEHMAVRLVDPADLPRLIQEGDIVHGIHVAALLMAGVVPAEAIFRLPED